jgi:spore coat protein U-like protein
MTNPNSNLSHRAVAHHRRKHFGVAAALFFALSQPAFSETSCEVNSVSAVDFGSYDVFSSLNDNSVGSITIRCKGGGSTALVALSSGQSNSYSSRLMRSAGNSLNYNLYTSAARIVVWGDGSGGSSALSVNRNSTTTLSVFGQIPAGQDAAVGAYSDSVTTIITF